MVQYNEESMSRPSECDSRPSTSGSGPLFSSKSSIPRWPGGVRPKLFNQYSISSSSRPSVLSRATDSLRSASRHSSRLGSRNSILSSSIHTADEYGSGTSRLRRELPSISDICGYDEVQELLRDIETLECRRWNCDLETFTIQSSHVDLNFSQDFDYFAQDFDNTSRGDSRLSWDSHGGRQPGDNSPHSSNSSSPRRNKTANETIPNLALAWDDSHLKTSVGIFRLLLVVMSVITMTCACTVGTARLSIFVLPGAWRLRVVAFSCLFATLVTTVLIVLHISSLLHSLLIRWDRLVTIIYVLICICYFLSACLILQLLHVYHTSYLWIPAWTKQQLLITSLCSCICGVISIVLAVIASHGWPRYSRVLSDGSMTDNFTSHQMHTFTTINSTSCALPKSDSKATGRDITRTTLVHDSSQQMTATFTPDSLEEPPDNQWKSTRNNTQSVFHQFPSIPVVHGSPI